MLLFLSGHDVFIIEVTKKNISNPVLLNNKYITQNMTYLRKRPLEKFGDGHASLRPLLVPLLLPYYNIYCVFCFRMYEKTATCVTT